MSTTDLWESAARDHESERLSRAVASARVAASQFWPFLADAKGPNDFDNRLALVGERLDAIADTAAGGDPSLMLQVRSSLHEGFCEDWDSFRDAQQAEAQRLNAPRAAARRQGATGDKATCANCGQPIESIGVVQEGNSLGMTPGEHWVHISDDPRAPIGSAQCTGDHWGELATPKTGSRRTAADKPGPRVAGAGAYVTDPHNSGIRHDVAPGTKAEPGQQYATFAMTIWDWKVAGLPGSWQLGGEWFEQNTASRRTADYYDDLGPHFTENSFPQSDKREVARWGTSGGKFSLVLTKNKYGYDYDFYDRQWSTPRSSGSVGGSDDETAIAEIEAQIAKGWHGKGLTRLASRKTAGSKAARDLQVGDKISQGTVSKVDTTTTPGTVYVWVDGKNDPPAAAIFNHGDPVTVSDTTASLIRRIVTARRTHAEHREDAYAYGWAEAEKGTLLDEAKNGWATANPQKNDVPSHDSIAKAYEDVKFLKDRGHRTSAVEKASYDEGYAAGKRDRDNGDDPGYLAVSDKQSDYGRGYWDGYGGKEKSAAKTADWSLPFEDSGGERSGPVQPGGGGKFTVQPFTAPDPDNPQVIRWWIEVWPKPQYADLERSGTAISPGEAMRQAERAAADAVHEGVVASRRTAAKTRVVPSEQAGYGPGKWQAQYQQDDTWFDIGDPADTQDAAQRKADDYATTHGIPPFGSQPSASKTAGSATCNSCGANVPSNRERCPKCHSSDVRRDVGYDRIASLGTFAEYMAGFHAGRVAARAGLRSLGQHHDASEYGEGFRNGVMAFHRMGEFRKGAPFADYADFDACVKANSDKDDPEAYCGKIKHQTEDKTSKLAYDTNTVTCDNCGQKVDGGRSTCESCGANLDNQEDSRRTSKLRVTAGFLSMDDIPADYPVRPVAEDDNPPPNKLEPDPINGGMKRVTDYVTCGTCGLTWDDSIITSMTPAPSARCPFEYFHDYDDGYSDFTEASRKTAGYWYYHENGLAHGPFTDDEKAQMDSVRQPGATYEWEYQEGDGPVWGPGTLASRKRGSAFDNRWYVHTKSPWLIEASRTTAAEGRYEIIDTQNPDWRGMRFSDLARAQQELAQSVPAGRFYIKDCETGQKVTGSRRPFADRTAGSKVAKEVQTCDGCGKQTDQWTIAKGFDLLCDDCLLHRQAEDFRQNKQGARKTAGVQQGYWIIDPDGHPVEGFYTWDEMFAALQARGGGAAGWSEGSVSTMTPSQMQEAEQIEQSNLPGPNLWLEDLPGRAGAKTAAIPTGRSDYKPGMGRVGEPSPQSNPEMFSSEDILAEIKYLIGMNSRLGTSPLRTSAYIKLMKVLQDRGYTGPKKTAAENSWSEGYTNSNYEPNVLRTLTYGAPAVAGGSEDGPWLDGAVKVNMNGSCRWEVVLLSPSGGESVIEEGTAASDDEAKASVERVIRQFQGSGLSADDLAAEGSKTAERIVCRHGRTIEQGCQQCLSDSDWHVEASKQASKQATTLADEKGRQADASVILRQIGTMNLAACGARDYVDLGDGIMFRVGPGRPFRKIIVKLNARDYYDVQLVTLGTGANIGSSVVEYEARDVDAAQLGEIVYAAVNKREGARTAAEWRDDSLGFPRTLLNSEVNGYPVTVMDWNGGREGPDRAYHWAVGDRGPGSDVAMGWAASIEEAQRAAEQAAMSLTASLHTASPGYVCPICVTKFRCPQGHLRKGDETVCKEDGGKFRCAGGHYPQAPKTGARKTAGALSDEQARKLAGDWHGGQSSPLYSFSSTGTITDDTVGEVDEVMQQVATQNGTDSSEYAELASLKAYLEAHLNQAAPAIGDKAEKDPNPFQGSRTVTYTGASTNSNGATLLPSFFANDFTDGNPFGDANPMSGGAPLSDTEQGVADPVSTRPRQKPQGPQPDDAFPSEQQAPVTSAPPPDPNAAEAPQRAVTVASKVMEVADGIRANNPGIPPAMAVHMARETVERFPKMVATS